MKQFASVTTQSNDTPQTLQLFLDFVNQPGFWSCSKFYQVLQQWPADEKEFFIGRMLFRSSNQQLQNINTAAAAATTTTTPI